MRKIPFKDAHLSGILNNITCVDKLHTIAEITILILRILPFHGLHEPKVTAILQSYLID